MAIKYYYIDYTGSGKNFITHEDTLETGSFIESYGGGIFRTKNVNPWVTKWNGTELSHSQAQNMYDTFLTNSANEILPSKHSESIKYWYVDGTGSISASDVFINNSDTITDFIQDFGGGIYRTKNTNWTTRVGAIELCQIQAEDMYQEYHYSLLAELSASMEENNNGLPI